jgi:hypothetical protein
MESRVNYILLLIVITIGVATGNLISNWIIASYLSAEVEKTSVEISKALSNRPKKNQKIINKPTKSIVTEDASSQQSLIEQRKLDKNGIRLAKNCSEWTVAHKDMQTQTSERGMKKHCELYDTYIRTGALPHNN